MPSIFRARIYLITASLIWAIESAIFAATKGAYRAELFLFLRDVLVVGFALAWLAMRRELHLMRVPRELIKPLIIVSLFAGFFGELGYYFALQYVPIVNGLLIGHLQPFFMLLIGYLVFKEQPLTLLQILGGTVMFIASLFVSAGSWEALLAFEFGVWQNLILVGCSIVWSVSALMAKHYLMGLNPTVVILYRYLIVLGFVGAVVVATGSFELPNLFVLGNALSVFCGLCLYYLGLRALPAAEVGFLELFSPLFGLLIGALFVAQGATLLQLAGCLLMFVGFWALVKGEREV